MIEPKIGEVFKFNLKKLKCIEWTGREDDTACYMCALARYYPCIFECACLPTERKDGKTVFFKEVENEKA